MKAWWSGSIWEFLATDAETIIGALSARAIEAHPLNRDTQVMAWRATIPILKRALAEAPGSWRLLLEYPLLRLGRQIDAILLTANAICVLEFKVGARTITNDARQQVDDYALDLRDFHAGSRDHPIVPILIATEARTVEPRWPLIMAGVIACVIEANAGNLRSRLDALFARLPATDRSLPVDDWEAMPYRPVPTIIDAARMLYSRHSVAELAQSRADAGNLGATTDAIVARVNDAREQRHHVVIFVTGIPGAGKTLCGLNVVFGTETNGAFLTGNLPLVHVIRRALVRDAVQQEQGRRMAEQKVEAAIQPLMGFLRDNLDRTEPPHEHVIVFDEAKRAWDAAYGKRKFDRNDSEAALFLDIMRRHADWAVIVALVGSGQEINTGEAGLMSWGQALSQRPYWHIHAPSGVLAAHDPRHRLFESAPPQFHADDALHLSVPVRSIRTDAAAPWVDAVLASDPARARRIVDQAGGVPFYLTRSLADMRGELRSRARGERRAGLVCSAKAKRLRADGVWPEFPHLEADTVANWFLMRWPDIRASDALEVPATQFACQGLELDFVGLCWGNDLIRAGDEWVARTLSGSRWQVLRTEAKRAYQVNTYRVLMTRARYDTVIWVPPGDRADGTRDPESFDAIADYLQECGATLLEDALDPAPRPVDAQGFLL